MTYQQLPLRLHYPPTNGTDTSDAAARSVAGDAHIQRERIYTFLRAQGAHGATDQEIEAELGLAGNTVRPRRGELERAGRVALTDLRRPTPSGRMARVYEAVRP